MGIGQLAGGIESIFSGFDKANAATSAANAQAGAANQGANFLQGILNNQQSNQNPFIQGGQSTMGQLLSGINAGTFGTPGQAPQYTGGAFVAPTAAEAAATPGYQFTQQEGAKGLLQGAAASGGAISGGTLRALDSYNSGLAQNTYGNTFNRALQGYNAGLSQYAAQLQGFGAQQGANQQAFNQLFQPTALGEQAAGSLNQSELGTGADIASEYNNAGNAQAAGLIGSTNALWGGLQSGTNQVFGGGNYGQISNSFGGGGGSIGGALAAGGGIPSSGGNPLPAVGPISPFNAAGAP